MQICNSHYPTFEELINNLPKAIERIQKSKCIGVEEVTCNNATTKSYKPKNVKDNKPYCSLCEKENHYSSECVRYPSIHERINRLRDLKRCTFCGRKGHVSKPKDKGRCGRLVCGHCKKNGNVSIMC